jgi:hypothetical protein
MEKGPTEGEEGYRAPVERVPLVVGVTGHRDLLPEEQNGIKARVRAFFLQMQESFPDLPLMMMSPLAEGADRIAAEVAHELGVPIIVLLPMPEHLYKSDFEGPSLREYLAMRELGERIELPLLPELAEADVLEPGAGRDLQYAQLGAYLAAHSHVLLAIWDGKSSNAPGGTGHVIKFHQLDVIELIADGQHRSPIDFTEDESDLVHHIVCSRVESGPPESGLEPGRAYWFTRDELRPRTLYLPDRYRMVFQRMAEFSADLKQPVDEAAFYPLLPEEDLEQCGQGARDIDHLYHRADALARRYQRYFLRVVWATSLLALTAGICFVAFADWPGIDSMLPPYILCVVVVLALAGLDRRFSWQRKYLDYRVLAEGLRVQFYWAVAGIAMENPSRFSHDSFLKRQDLELGWIRNVMRFAGFRSDSKDRTSSEAHVALCMTHWVQDQHGYYHRKAIERERRQRVTSVFNLICFVLLLAAALMLAFRGDVADTTLGDVLIALMGLLPFAIAARQNHAFRTAESELLAQFQHYVRIFQNAQSLMTRAPTLEMKKEILRAVGEAALEENGQWILRQRERPSVATQSIQG